MNILNLNHLYYFFTAAQHKTITHAAKTLGISQPSLTSQLKILETRLARSLFRKSGRNVFLTVEGEYLLKLCRPIFESVQELENKIQLGAQNPLQQKLRIGFTEQIEEMFIAELVSQILQTQTLHLTAICERKETLLNQLKNHELDLVFTNTGTTEPDIEIIQHYRMPVGLYISRKLYKKYGKKSMQELLKNQEIGFSLPNAQVRLRHEIEEYFEKAKIKGAVLFQSDTLSLVARAVVDGVGMGFFPRPYLKEEEEDGKVICLTGKNSLWFHSLYLTSHHHFEQTPAIKEMITMIKRYFSQF